MRRVKCSRKTGSTRLKCEYKTFIRKYGKNEIVDCSFQNCSFCEFYCGDALSKKATKEILDWFNRNVDKLSFEQYEQLGNFLEVLVDEECEDCKGRKTFRRWTGTQWIVGQCKTCKGLGKKL